MTFSDIVLSRHASMQMKRRKVTLDDLNFVIRLGDHVDGKEAGTLEACAELDGRYLTVVYDSMQHQYDGIFRVITVLRRRCGE